MHESTTETQEGWVQGARELVLCLILLVMGALPFAISTNDWCGPVSAFPWMRSMPPGATGAALVIATAACIGYRTVHWSMALAATIHGSVWVENVVEIHHVWHLPVLLAWLEATPALRHDWIRRLTVGGWHFHAAAAKTMAHGLGWADGHSMRVWVEAFAFPWARNAVQYAPTWLLAAGQWGALVAEGLAPLAVWKPRAVGWALITFYLLVIATFPFGFALNALLVWLYLVERY